jgi:hypothetical protein
MLCSVLEGECGDEEDQRSTLIAFYYYNLYDYKTMFLGHFVFIRVIDLTISQIRVMYIVVLKLEAAVAAQ